MAPSACCSRVELRTPDAHREPFPLSPPPAGLQSWKGQGMAGPDGVSSSSSLSIFLPTAPALGPREAT